MALPQKKPEVHPADVMEGLIIRGDLEGLTPDQRVVYYNRVCDSIGVNPLTQPFQYMKLQGKLILYATRACADQLRKLHGINIEIVSEDVKDGMLIIHTRARDATGRVDEDLGVVPFPETLRGEVRANTILRCVTKSKRRVTLSIAGLGYLDETEVESIPGAEKVPPKPVTAMRPAELSSGERIDRETGEIIEPAVPSAASGITAEAAPPEDTPEDGAATLSTLDMAREAARHGENQFRTYWKTLDAKQREEVTTIATELKELSDAAAKESESGRPY